MYAYLASTFRFSPSEDFPPYRLLRRFKARYRRWKLGTAMETEADIVPEKTP